MPNIYLFSYCGGHGGDFFCRQISQDPNYYSTLFKQITNNNQWINDNPFEKYNLNFKKITREIDVYSISDSIRDQIDREFSDKNLIVPAHNMTELLPNLPRLKRLKLVSTDNNVYFYYTLLCIKSWCTCYDLKIYHEEMSPRFDQFKLMHQNNPLMLEKIKIIEDRGYVYAWEMQSIFVGLTNSIDVIKQHLPIYQRKNKLLLANSINLDLDAMYANPQAQVDHWSTVSGMQTTLNANVIAEYHQKNIDLIETKLNLRLDQYNNSNWLEELIQWVKTTCPDSY
jgi:hypothetical protein